MNTPQNSKYKYGILLVNGRYVAETPVEGKSYVMFFEESGFTTAGCDLRLVDAEGHDPLARKGWRYHAHCEWGCFYHYTRPKYYICIDKYDVGKYYIEKDRQKVLFDMEDGDDMLSDFTNFMMDILQKCETLDDVKQLYVEYLKDHFHKHLSEEDKRNAEELAKFGNQYLNGTCPKEIRKYVTAFGLFTKYAKAAAAGSVEGQYGLGVCYASGYGVEQNTRRAIEWYTKAAETGHMRAQLSLAELHAAEAEKWMTEYYGGNTDMALQELARCYGFVLAPEKKSHSKPKPNDDGPLLF